MISELIEKACGKKPDYAEIGRRLRQLSPTDEELKNFMTAMLDAQAYVGLAAVMSAGYIFENGTTRAYSYGLEGGLLDAFLKLAHRCGMSDESLYPMLFASSKAPVHSLLKKWEEPFAQSIRKLALEDFDKTEKLVRTYDKDCRFFSSLLSADSKKAVAALEKELLGSGGRNKVKLRRLLLDNRVDLVADMIAAYDGADARYKEKLVRGLLVYKGDRRADGFLKELLDRKEPAAVKKLIRGVSASRSGLTPSGAEFIRGCLTVTEDGKVYSFPVEESAEKIDLSSVASPRGKEIAESLNAVIDADKKALFDMMLRGDRIGYPEFIQNVLGDGVACALASTLFFGVYTYGALSAIVIVDDGKILDLNNKPITLNENDELDVLHPALFGSGYSFLKNITVKQCIPQITRKTFMPSDDMRFLNCVKDKSGLIISAYKLKKGLKENGFKLLGTDDNKRCQGAAKIMEGVMCVIAFEPVDLSLAGASVLIKDFSFYHEASAVRIGRQLFAGGEPIRISSLPIRLYSELVLAATSALGAK